MPAQSTARLSVGIATRNRAGSLLRCLASITLIDDLVSDIIVVDDSSDPPIGEMLRSAPQSIQSKMRFIEQPGAQGPIVARNTIMRLALNDAVMLFDDDAFVIDGRAVRNALSVLEQNPAVGAVACAQAEADGSPWPAAMQPAPAGYPCYVTAYIGFAHLLRRNLFLELGGYQESFHFYGEEKDYCLRLLNAGYDVVYLPDARVAHVPDPSGRSDARYLRYVVRNDCLSALYNEPLAMAIVTVPIRVARYAVMRRHGRVKDSVGLRWVIGELIASLPAVWRTRKPMRWTSIRRWRRLRRTWPAFQSRVTASA